MFSCISGGWGGGGGGGGQEVKRVREQNKTKRNIELPLALPVCEQQTVSQKGK